LWDTMYFCFSLMYTLKLCSTVVAQSL
jgi:hypothetical protein